MSTRSGGNRGGSGGASAAVTVRERVARRYGGDLRAALDREERSIRSRAKEVGVAFAPDGRVIARATGTHHRLYFPREHDLAGAVVTHNHPLADLRLGSMGSFSSADIHFAASRGLAEIRAVDRHYRYSMRPPASGWSADT